METVQVTTSPQQPLPVQFSQPWWSRLLEKHGFTTLFACVCLYAGWEFTKAHFKFLDSQTAQMEAQTDVLVKISNTADEHTRELKQILQSSERQEDNQTQLQDVLLKENRQIFDEHKKMIDSLDNIKNGRKP